MAGDREIETGSDLYKMTLSNFKANLEKILNYGKNTRILLIPQISNLKDLQPFGFKFENGKTNIDISFMVKQIAQSIDHSKTNDSLYSFWQANSCCVKGKRNLPKNIFYRQKILTVSVSAV